MGKVDYLSKYNDPSSKKSKKKKKKKSIRENEIRLLDDEDDLRVVPVNQHQQPQDGDETDQDDQPIVVNSMIIPYSDKSDDEKKYRHSQDWKIVESLERSNSAAASRKPRYDSDDEEQTLPVKSNATNRLRKQKRRYDSDSDSVQSNHDNLGNIHENVSRRPQRHGTSLESPSIKGEQLASDDDSVQVQTRKQRYDSENDDDDDDDDDDNDVASTMRNKQLDSNLKREHKAIRRKKRYDSDDDNDHDISSTANDDSHNNNNNNNNNKGYKSKLDYLEVDPKVGEGVKSSQSVVPRALTSSGHAAGLQKAGDFRKTEQQIQEKRKIEAQAMVDKYGVGETVYRNERGKKVDLVEGDKVHKLNAREEVELRKGTVQREQEAMFKREYQELQDASFARHQDDDKLETLRKDAIRKGDPMAGSFAKKIASTSASSGKPTKPMYKGPPPKPNRFGIPPGFRWDGVDRGNRFEDKALANKFSANHKKEQAYRWSTSDM